MPAKAALKDAATEFGAPGAVADEAIDTFIVNLRFLGLLVTLSGAEPIVSTEHALDQLPSSTNQTQAKVEVRQQGAVITADRTQYETTCFYISPIGAVESEQSKHSDLFLGSLIEPALQAFNLTVIRADAMSLP